MALLQLEVVTPRLLLKVIGPAEANLVLDYYIRNRDFLREWEPYRPEGFYSLLFMQELLRQERNEIEKMSCLRYWIFLKEDFRAGIERIIGTVSYSDIIRGVFQSCYLGYKLDKDEVNKGYMKEALRATIPIIFNDYRLHRIEANIMPHNIASLSVVRSLGFQEEGLARKFLKINNKWQDHIRMVLLNEAVE